MKRIILFVLLFVLSSGLALAQTKIKKKDIKIEDDVVHYLGKKQFVIETRNLANDHYIKDHQTGDLLLSLIRREAPSLDGVTKSNPDGLDPYLELTFLKTGAKCDYVPPMPGRKSIAKDLLSFGVFADGALDEGKLEQFMLMKGTPYTDRSQRTVIVR